MAKAREATITAVEDSELRSRMLNRMTMAGMATLLLLLPLVYLRSRAMGDVFLTSVQACAYVVLLVALLLRRRFQPSTHTVLFLVGLFVLVFSAMAHLGFAAPGAIAAPFVPIFAAIVFGRRVSIAILALCIVVGAFIAVLHVSGVIRPALDMPSFVRAPSAWATILFVQFALAAWYLFTIAPIHEAERRTTARLDAVIDGLNDALFIQDKNGA